VPPGTPNPNPWIAIQGANSQTLTINGTDDLLYYFKVVVVQGACSAESQVILADGYNFGLPYLIANFEPGTFQSLGNNNFNVCNGASVVLENGFDQVYGLHTWYKCIPVGIPPVPGDPCIIPNENGDTYTATTTGFYGFWACTSYCPDICLFLGLPSFLQLNFGDWSFCSLGTEDPIKSNEVLLYPNPTIQLLYLGKPNDEYNADILITDMMGKEVLTIKNYDYAQPIDVSHLLTGTYLMILKSNSGKMLRNKFIKKTE
jgi:hypothetical protein